MSRGSDYDGEEDWPNQAEFWWHNAQRALKGKRGRKALAELREALLMLPERRLVSGAISTAALAAEAEKLSDTDTMPQYPWEAKAPDGPNWMKTDAIAKCETEGIGVCAVGAYLLRKRVLEFGETPDEAMRKLPAGADVWDCTLTDTARYGQQAGLTEHLAYMWADRNDETYGGCTPEERYERFLTWIDQELAA